MALSDLGISFGNFEAEEYESLFGNLENPQHGRLLELPWNEDACVADAASDPVQGGPGGTGKALNESAAGRPQWQQQGSQHQQEKQKCQKQQQYESTQVQPSHPVHQQRLLQQQQETLQSQLQQVLQSQQQQQQQQWQATPGVAAVRPGTENALACTSSLSSTQAPSSALPRESAQKYPQVLPHTQPNLAAQGHAGNPQTAAPQMGTTPAAVPNPYSNQSLPGCATHAPQAPAVIMPEAARDEGSGGSDRQTDEAQDSAKRRRNKKKRDPSFYTTFYDDSNQHNRTETAYYADNESSGSSSGASSEAAAGGSVGIAAAVLPNQAAKEGSQIVPKLPVNKTVQLADAPSDQNTTKVLSHHEPERTSPVVSLAERGRPSSNGPPIPQISANAARRATQATEPSAIQTPAPPTTGRQAAAENPRTAAKGGASPQGSSVQSGDSLQAEAKQGLPGDSDAARDSAQVVAETEDAGSSGAQPRDPNLCTVDASSGPPETAADQVESSALTSPAPAPAPRPSSWASLFKSSASSPAAQPSVVSSPAPADAPQASVATATELADVDDKTPVSMHRDPRAKVLGDALSRVSLSHRAMYILPRGLKNVGNWCYVNSILQALLACPPFYHLMKYLPFFPMQRGPSSTPMLDAMVELVSKFSEQMTRAVPKKGVPDVKPAVAIEPSVVYQMMAVADTSLSVKQGCQEDAEEFLGCLLNGLHEEMLALLKHFSPEQYGDVNGPASAKTNGLPTTIHAMDEKEVEEEEGGNEDEWEQVGPRNKSAITRAAHFHRSPLYNIFGGQMRSALHQQGSKESATLQPFFTLQLDIQSENIWSVREAIENLGSREALHGFTCIKTKQEVEASRRITLEELPPVLILHLKRFVYDKSGGCQKVMKKLDYSVELEINRDLLSQSIKSKILIKQRTYKLFAVVYHTGKETSGGHYITDVFHAGSNSWLRLDDSSVKPIRLAHVIKPLAAYTPYLLFYRRCDLI